MPHTKTFTIPNHEISRFQNALDVIGNHWDFDNDSLTIRQCVYQVNAWIKGDKELVNSNGRYNKEEQQQSIDEFVGNIWSDFDKNAKEYSPEQLVRKMKPLFKEVILRFREENIELYERLKKYEQRL